MINPPSWVQEAKHLAAGGVSSRRIAEAVGVKSHKTVLYWLDPEIRRRHIEWASSRNGKRSKETQKRARLRSEARIQAEEEGVSPIEVYKRWGVYSPKADDGREARV